MSNNYNILLPSLFLDDTLSSSEVSEIIDKMRRHKQIEKEYQNKIKKRKDGRQYYIIVKRKQITATTLDALYDKIYDLQYGRQRATLTDLYSEWMIWKRDNTYVNSKTLKENHYIWEKMLMDTDIVSIPICDLRVKDFNQFFRNITKDRQLTKKRFANMKSILNGIYYYAIEQDIITHNPIQDIDCKHLPFKPENHKSQVFSINERELMLKYLDTQKNIYALAIQLDFCLVLRIGELLALRWSDIEDNNIHIQGQRIIHNTMNDDLTFSKREYENVNHIKGYTQQGFRYQPLTKKALEVLAKIKELNPDGEYILMQDGKQLYTDTFNKYLKKYCNEIGIEPRSSHKIRFTTASILYSQGLPLTNLQALLGHTTPAMTLHYIKQVTPSNMTTDIMQSALG